uniref:Mercuric reductase n=1 Tax=Odontella aurita TaxID=265563 RepID=A0A7S4HPD7_9STRA
MTTAAAALLLAAALALLLPRGAAAFSSSPSAAERFSRRHRTAPPSMAADSDDAENKNSSSSETKSYDLVVIGGGSAGLTAAKFASTFGFSSVIIEKSRLGGDCTWTGCVPSKSLVASAKAARVVRKAEDYGVIVGDKNGGGDVTVDMKRVMGRMRENMERIYEEDDSPAAMAKLGIDTLVGSARFTSADTLSVTSSTTTTEVRANEGIVICTGAKPRRPTSDDIPGLDDDVEYLTYDEIFEIEDLPPRITVAGGGPIGCELAQVFGRFGSEVTVVARRLLPKCEPVVSETLATVFEKEGINVVQGTIASVAKDGKGHTAACQCSDGSEVSVSGDLLLVAVGRIPVAFGMGLDDVGIDVDPSTGGIAVDDNLRTSLRGVYAAGDCTGGAQFTHYAGYQGAVAARNVLLPLTDPGVLPNVPGTTFTDPEVATAGLTEAEAIEEYGEGKVSVAVQKVRDIDRAICDGADEGLIKIVYKKRGYKILGATIMSPAAGEMIAEIGVAMKTGLTFDMLATVMHTYPAYSFALQAMAAEVYYDKLLKSKGLFSVLKKIGL